MVNHIKEPSAMFNDLTLCGRLQGTGHSSSRRRRRQSVTAQVFHKLFSSHVLIVVIQSATDIIVNL